MRIVFVGGTNFFPFYLYDRFISNVEILVYNLYRFSAAPQPSVTPSISIAKGCGCDDVRQLGKLRYWLDIILIVDSSDGVSFGDFVAVSMCR